MSLKFKQFEVGGAAEDNILVNLHFGFPEDFEVSGRCIYKEPPWTVYEDQDKIYYECIPPDPPRKIHLRKAVADRWHSRIDIYNDDELRKEYLAGELDALTLFQSDQILLGRALAPRGGFIIHSSAAIVNDSGFLFPGHSGYGKSTAARMMEKIGRIICDDRNIIMKHGKNGFELHGSWSQGSLNYINNRSASLSGIFFIEQALENRIERIIDRKKIVKYLLSYVITPVVTPDWWEYILDLIEQIVDSIPCYTMEFDLSGRIAEEIKKLT